MGGAQPLEHGDVPGASAPEPVVVADDDLRRAEARDDQVLHELFGRVTGELGREGDERGVVEPELSEDFLLLVRQREERRGNFGTHDAQGVRVEREEYGMAVSRAGAPPNLPQDRLVSEVNPIEGPHGDDRTPDVRGESVHAANTFFGWR